MKTKKIIHYSIAVSPRFPADHKRKGEPTYFVFKIENEIHDYEFSSIKQYDDNNNETLIVIYDRKLHTIRKNYPMWVKRMEKVNRGEAVIDIFCWKLPGGRYTKGNEPVVFATLDKDSGCGVQVVNPNNELTFWYVPITEDLKDFSKPIYVNELAKNDGLSLYDFKSWFKGYDLSQPMAIIHFTSFRY